MFGFGKPDKRKVVLADISASLPVALPRLHAVERATVLLMTNCMLGYAGRTYGEAFAGDPRKADVKAARTLFDNLLQVRDGLVEITKTMKDAQRRHVVCHQYAAELALLTIGLAIGVEHSRAVSACWKSIWTAKANLRQAVPWVRKYEGATGLEAVPRLANGQEPSDIDLLKIGGTLPAFLRRRKAAPVAG